MGDEADRPAARLARRHEAADGAEEAGNSLIVGVELLLELIEPLGEFAPCSVKAWGRYLRCWPRPVFKVANCDLRESHSSLESSNMKSAGKRSELRRTCSLKRLVVTP